MKRTLLTAAVMAALVLTPAAGKQATPVLASGRLLLNGHGVAGTIRVFRLPVNGSSDLVKLAQVKVGSSGTFNVHLANSSEMAPAANQNNGYVGFRLMAVSGDQFKVMTFSRRYVDGQWQGRFETKPLTVNLDKGGTASPTSCVEGYRKVGDTDAWTVVAEAHTAWDMSDTVTYGKTADSDISTMLSYNNSLFNISGTLHVGTASGSSISKTWGEDKGKRWRSKFHYEDWYQCYYVYPNWYETWEWQPTKWIAGSDVGSDVHDKDFLCYEDHYQWRAIFDGGDYDRTTKDYATFTEAATVAGIAGFTAQSGLSTWVELHWVFSANNKWLCGNDNFVPDAKQIFAGK